MVPATAGEISEATGLDSLVTEATLEHMAARYQVMFNPLTKRFSLPKLWAARRFAACPPLRPAAWGSCPPQSAVTKRATSAVGGMASEIPARQAIWTPPRWQTGRALHLY